MCGKIQGRNQREGSYMLAACLASDWWSKFWIYLPTAQSQHSVLCGRMDTSKRITYFNFIYVLVLIAYNHSWYSQSNPLIRRRPVIVWARTSSTMGLLIDGGQLGFPNVKSVASVRILNGDSIGLSNSSKQTFVSSDNVIVGKTCRWLAMYS